MSFIIAFLGLINISMAQDFVLEERMKGSFEFFSSYEGENHRYLDCTASRELEITEANGVISLQGHSPYPLEFKNINQGPIGVPGPLVGFGQRRTIISEDSEFNLKIISQYRQCEPFLGKAGCFLKKWRTNSTLEFTRYVDGTSVEVRYQPFADIPEEICTYRK